MRIGTIKQTVLESKKRSDFLNKDLLPTNHFFSSIDIQLNFKINDFPPDPELFEKNIDYILSKIKCVMNMFIKINTKNKNIIVYKHPKLLKKDKNFINVQINLCCEPTEKDKIKFNIQLEELIKELKKVN